MAGRFEQSWETLTSSTNTRIREASASGSASNHTVYMYSMYGDLVLSRKLNHRNIELHHTTRGEVVGVLCRDGDYRYVSWLGFISAADAVRMAGARPVKLLIDRVGRTEDMTTVWNDVAQGNVYRHQSDVPKATESESLTTSMRVEFDEKRGRHA